MANNVKTSIDETSGYTQVIFEDIEESVEYDEDIWKIDSLYDETDIADGSSFNEEFAEEFFLDGNMTNDFDYFYKSFLEDSEPLDLADLDGIEIV